MWAGSFEREAIRPHVLGRFADMLKAVEQHPAMLFFLDNQQSLGPDFPRRAEPQARPERKSRARNHGAAYARRRRRLHPGRRRPRWRASSPAGPLPDGRDSSARPAASSSTPTRISRARSALLGKIYEDNGVAQGEAALADIARHPSTAKFIATKFARHFVADDPPPALVARLQDVFRKSDGDLRALTLALLDSDEAWQAPLTKVRSPYEFLVATGRLLARIPEDPGRYLGGLNRAGPAAVVAGRAERISRYQCGMGGAGGDEAAARHLGADRLASRRQYRSPRSAGTRRRRRGVAGNAAHHRARGIAAAGAGAAC